MNLSDKNSCIVTLIETLIELDTSGKKQTSDKLDKLETTLAEMKDIVAQASRPQSDIDIIRTPLPRQLDYLIEVGDGAVASVLTSLKFDSMYFREANVSAAHSKTFQWLFDNQSDFYKWLSANPTGPFWISGKPGSGKSTLMKFISRQETCQEALQAWTKDELLITAHFYFWSAGTPMQKSLQGLLQTILYQIMKACPLLIPSIAPNRWAGALDKTVEDPWTWDEALATLNRFIHQKAIRCSTCLFIDGLDEFDGNYAHLVDVFSQIPSSSNMKVCLSSRPYNHFVDAYGRSPDRMIRLQDLTTEDIRQYVNDSFEKHTSITSMTIQTEQYNALVDEIVNKADGVFLWVELVVQSLKDGLTNADTISKLRQRLKALPSDLSEYFDHILNAVEPVYWEDTSKVFQMALSAQYPLPPGVLSILDTEEENYYLKVNATSMPLQHYENSVRVIEKRLNARCKGLLEIRDTPKHLYGSDGYQDRYLVNFLHRTVRDFLRNEDVLTRLKSRLSAPFNVDISLCQGYLLHIKQFIIMEDPVICRHLSFIKAFEDLTYFAHRHEKISGTSLFDMLDEAFHAAEVVRRLNPDITETMLLCVVVRFGLVRYLERRFRTKNFKASSASDVEQVNMMNSLLQEAMLCAAAQSQGSRYDYGLHPSVIQVLLQHGANPNSIYRETGETLWRYFLRHLHSSGGKYAKENPDECLEACVLLLNAGAERSRGIKIALTSDLLPTKQTRILERLIGELNTTGSGELIIWS